MPPYIPLDDQIADLRRLYDEQPEDAADQGWEKWAYDWCLAAEKFLLCVKNCPDRKAAEVIKLGAIAAQLHARPSWTPWMEIAVPQARVYLERWAQAYAAQTVRGKVPGLSIQEENDLVEEEIQEVMIRADTGEFDNDPWACQAVTRGFDHEDLVYRRPKSQGERLWNDWCLAGKEGVRGDKVRARAAVAATEYAATAPVSASRRRKRVSRGDVEEGGEGPVPVGDHREESPDTTPRPVKKSRSKKVAGAAGEDEEPDFEPGEVAKELAGDAASGAYSARLARRRFLKAGGAPRPIAEWLISGTVVEPGCQRCSLKTVRYVCRQEADRATCIKCRDMHEQCSLAQGVKPGPRRKSSGQTAKAVPRVAADTSPLSMGTNPFLNVPTLQYWVLGQARGSRALSYHIW
ncbi:hypothetical protein BV25DRAFT_1917702 [Artomyces pyxidatus]|uniref:Uncharacterized protein n=1 Tax=Artomyces pyxidatus TaxID=48021 RepID=A0ACB8SXC3_9AGAM|nr:hypothetical protein BV25DRAFT_1917702 [Artomyces pyxidatus]